MSKHDYESSLPESAYDLQKLYLAQGRTESARYLRDYASTLLELRRTQEAVAEILSQHDPVARLGVDREALRVLLSYINHHDTARLERETDAMLRAREAGHENNG